MNDFAKTIGILHDIYQEDKQFLPSIFWNTIDNLPNETLFNWVERMLSIRNLLLGQDYLRVVGIQHQFRQYKTWTDTQKRSIAMDLIKNWYTVEMYSELV